VDVDDKELATEVGSALRKKKGRSLKEKRKAKKIARQKPRNQVVFPKRKPSTRRQPRI
jgi:hypothetical protein